MIDIGVNLTSKQFTEDRVAVLKRAARQLSAMILTGSCEQSNAAVADYCKQYQHCLPLFFTTGLHPHHARLFSDATLTQMQQLATNPHHVAMGEMGLDYYRMFSSVEQQQRAFAAQLELAIAMGKPVFLHQRDAHSDFIKVIQQSNLDCNRGVVHCFTDSKQALLDYLDLGFYIGITGWVTEPKRGQPLREIVPLIPDDRLLIETDAPYLKPQNLPFDTATRRNEPAYLLYVAKSIAKLRNQPLAELVEITKANACKLFNLKL